MIGRLRTRPLVDRRQSADGLVALLVLGLTPALLSRRGDAGRSLDPLGVVVAALASLPLLARQRAVVVVFARTAVSAAINGPR